MDENEVLSVLMAFFEAMGKWESDSKALYQRAKKQELDYEDARRQSLSGLRQVFEKYCAGADPPARARYGAPHVSMIPTYGAQLEDVLFVEINGNRAEVLTKHNTGPSMLLRYNMVKMADGWRIEDNRRLVQPDGREEDWDL